MDVTTALLTILGLAVFESITSIDNAIINAEVLATMQARARRWFLTWGLLFLEVLEARQSGRTLTARRISESKKFRASWAQRR